MTVKQKKALEAAQRFQEHREAVARSLDEMAAAFAEMVCSHVRIARAQQTQLREAGLVDLAPNVGPSLVRVEAALAHALDDMERERPDAKIVGAFAWRDHISPRKPLSETDHRPAALQTGGAR